MSKIRLPERAHQPVVEGDFLTEYYHTPLMRNFFVGRLGLIYDFIRNRRFSRILEIGFGSGVFFPQLSKLSKEVYGIDIHGRFAEVEEMLKHENLDAHLAVADTVHLPFRDACFDCVVSISALEHIELLHAAIAEIRRVLKRGAEAVLGFPVANRFTDFLLRSLGAESDHKKQLHKIHPNTHADIIAEVKRQFGNIQITKIPGFLPLDYSLYCGCLCRKVA